MHNPLSPQGFPIMRMTQLTLACVCLLYTSSAWAHRPVFTDDAATGPGTAVPMGGPEVSQVVYREITEDSPQVWLRFDVPEDFQLYVQIGVPVLERLKDFRPAMVVVGPGLPTENPPFALPEGMGAKVLGTADVEKPRLFHEHFTGTDSWILRSATVDLPDSGRYYLVAYSPEGKTGKLWLSIGRKERFTADDWKQFPAWRKRIRAFHESP